MLRGHTLSVLGTWALALLVVGWTFVILMGQTNTQGRPPTAAAYLLVLLPLGGVLLLSLWRLWRIHAAVGFQLAWWLTLTPALFTAYLALGLTVSLLQGK